MSGVGTTFETRIFMHLVSVFQEDGRATVRSVAMDAHTSIGQTHAALSRLASKGLVAWDVGRRGTLRPLYGVVRELEAVR